MAVYQVNYKTTLDVEMPVAIKVAYIEGTSVGDANTKLLAADNTAIIQSIIELQNTMVIE
jgi:hypothetical protein